MNENESSLDIPEQEPCAFCDYLNGVRPFTVLYRDDLIAVLVTREQRGIDTCSCCRCGITRPCWNPSPASVIR